MTHSCDKSLSRICEVIMFENWLRFYFIVEEDDKLLIRLPEKSLEQIRTGYPSFAGLVEQLNNQEINHQRSMQAVCLAVAAELDGADGTESSVARVFDSSVFHLELQLFSSWVQAHEDQLDAGFMEFSQWQKMYADWKESAAVKEYIASVVDAAKRSAEGPVGTTQ